MKMTWKYNKLRKCVVISYSTLLTLTIKSSIIASHLKVIQNYALCSKYRVINLKFISFYFIRVAKKLNWRFLWLQRVIACIEPAKGYYKFDLFVGLSICLCVYLRVGLCICVSVYGSVVPKWMNQLGFCFVSMERSFNGEW